MNNLSAVYYMPIVSYLFCKITKKNYLRLKNIPL